MSPLAKMLSIVGGLGCSVCGVVTSGVTFSGSKTEGKKVLSSTLEENLTPSEEKAVDSSEDSEDLDELLSDEEQEEEDRIAKEELCDLWIKEDNRQEDVNKFIEEFCYGKAPK